MKTNSEGCTSLKRKVKKWMRKINITKGESKKNSKKWIFTFKISSKYQDHYAEFHGTKESAFEQIISRFEHEWSNQYSEDEYTNSMGLENILYHNI